MRDLKKEFPVLTQYTYLNTAYSGLMRVPLIAWRHKRDMDYLSTGSLYRDNHHIFTERVREEVGIFFNCKPDCVSLVPNFSSAFNTLISGLAPHKKVLLLKNDYPSVNEPFERGNFKVSYATINEELEKNILNCVSEYKPDILAFSIVQYINGIKIDLSFIKELKKNFPKLLIIADGTQYCGTENFDFENSGIDVLGASGYKWMLAGYGNAFMLFKKEVVPKIFSQNFSGVSKNEFSGYQAHLMNYFEPGHLDTLNFGSLLFSIQYMKSLEAKKIALQIKKLSIKAKEKLAAKGLLEDVVIKRSNHSSIFNIKGNSTLFKQLKSNNVICSQRGSGIRISFHFYNTENDLNTLLSYLDK